MVHRFPLAVLANVPVAAKVCMGMAAAAITEEPLPKLFNSIRRRAIASDVRPEVPVCIGSPWDGLVSDVEEGQFLGISGPERSCGGRCNGQLFNYSKYCALFV